jgi:hypothetical protein
MEAAQGELKHFRIFRLAAKRAFSSIFFSPRNPHMAKKLYKKIKLKKYIKI